MNNQYQELSPEMMAQAQLIGGRRQPTKAEKEKQYRQDLMVATLSISGNALSAMLEGGVENCPEAADFASEIAYTILNKSKADKDSFESHQKRMMRNQLAAQLLYSTLRSPDTWTGAINIKRMGVESSHQMVTAAFLQATHLLNRSEDYAEKAPSPID